MAVLIKVTEIGVCLPCQEETAPPLPPVSVNFSAVETTAVSGNSHRVVILVGSPADIATGIMGVLGISIIFDAVIIHRDFGIGGELSHSGVTEGEHIVDTALTAYGNRRINRWVFNDE